MKHNLVRYSVIVMLIGFGSLAAGQAYAQGPRDHIDILSFSWGFVSGQTTRVSVAHLGDASVRTIAYRIQLLDTEGEVIAQSDEIRIEPGQIRSWDVSRDQIRLVGDPGTGRIQVRATVIPSVTNEFSTAIFRFGRSPLAPTVEIIDASTGRTVMAYHVPTAFQIISAGQNRF